MPLQRSASERERDGAVVRASPPASAAAVPGGHRFDGVGQRRGHRGQFLRGRSRYGPRRCRCSRHGSNLLQKQVRSAVDTPKGGSGFTFSVLASSDIIPLSKLLTKIVFRYPERCYKRQQYQQQQQQQRHQRLPTTHLISQCSSENSDEDDADDLPAGRQTKGSSSFIFESAMNR